LSLLDDSLIIAVRSDRTSGCRSPAIIRVALHVMLNIDRRSFGGATHCDYDLLTIEALRITALQ
jgi:hypothetical protein